MVRRVVPSVPSPAMQTGDLTAAAAAVEAAGTVVERAIATLKSAGGVDANQVIAYELAHAAAAVETGRAVLGYGGRGEVEASITCADIADAVGDLAGKLYGREAEWG